MKKMENVKEKIASQDTKTVAETDAVTTFNTKVRKRNLSDSSKLSYMRLKAQLNISQINLYDPSIDKESLIENLLADLNMEKNSELMSLVLEKAGIVDQKGAFRQGYKNLKSIFTRY